MQAKFVESDAEEAVWPGGTRLRYEKDAARIPQPDAVGGAAVEAEGGAKRVGLFQYLARLPAGRGAVNDQLHPLMPCQVANYLGIDPRDRFELFRPVFAIMGPGEPRSRMRLPFGGAPIAAGHVSGIAGT